ncbi:hypothetical protein [Noviherbaspirillum autotrophicum]|uniref:Type IV pilin accessory protein n=1 Tax=Noviherbaspirillum autotrophicum TaxID=709839 RepID=A0A0C2BKF2_9BURK|nr:hypothetical protein [Noviherbaspirillum autotrophicum]KIF81725.1 hypothetical protein TSA66_14475 [Noviherbaspirillum autotrophicum]
MQKRLRASLVHLLISLFLVSSVLAFVLLICYPNPYYKIMGVHKLLFILALVDICLGPLITLVIFNPAKKWLKYELMLIGILQLSALAYGTTTIFVGRPVYIVFDENGFTLVSAYQIPETALKKMHDPSLPITGPKLVGARIPEDKELRRKYIDEVIDAHVDLPRMMQYHVPYESMVNDVKSKMRPLGLLLKRLPPEKSVEAKAILDDAVVRSGFRYDELAVIPMVERDSNLTVLVRRDNASVVSVLPIDPFAN